MESRRETKREKEKEREHFFTVKLNERRCFLFLKLKLKPMY